MNDISVKTVETPKEQVNCVEPAPLGESLQNETEVDPLAIDDGETGKEKDPLNLEQDEKEIEPVKAGTCDENDAKEVPVKVDILDENDSLSEQTAEKIKEELLTEDNSSINSAIDESSDNLEVKKDEESIPDEEPEVSEPKEEDSEPKLLEVTPVVITSVEVSPVEVTSVEATSVEVTPVEITAVEATAVEVTPLPEPVKEIKVTTVPETEVTIIEEAKVDKLDLQPPTEVKKIVQDKKEVVINNIVEIKNNIAEIKNNIAEKKEGKEKEIKLEEKVIEKSVDVEMTEAKEVKTEIKVEPKNVKPVNGDCRKEEATKRRASEDIDTESNPYKKLCQEIEKAYPNHDTMVTDYVQSTTKNNIDEVQRHTEQLLTEIHTLRDLAQKKEHEWNNILHLKKVKEEILLRLLRQKQVLAFEKNVELNGSESFDFMNHPKNYAIDKSDEISGVAMKLPPSTIGAPPPMQAPVMPVSSHYPPMSVLPPPYDKTAHLHNVPKNMYPSPMMMAGPTMPGFPRDMNGQLHTNFGLPMGRQGPTKDVKSIIADYRQRNPDITPRRGRRMKSLLNPNMMNPPRPIAPKVDNMNNLNNLGLLFNNLDMNQKAMLERLSQMQTTNLPNGLSFKDVLVQYANMQQQPNPSMLIRPEMMPTRPPEQHPMRPNDGRSSNRRPEKPSTTHTDTEMHISMKPCDRHTTASPRLPPPPPYPEISLLPVSSSCQDQGSGTSQQNSLLHGILTKNCGEITITPVQPPPPQAEPAAADKTDDVVQLDEEEAVSDGSASGEGEERRLVIDEGGSEEQTPLCQGCRRRHAQFVCAGCANQWYCSRDCQVAAWDEHSEMCSG